MTQAEFLGMLVISLVTLVGLFLSIYKPLKENTQAMTVLTVRVEELTKRIDEQKEDLEDYKEHVSNGQKKQWEEINKQGEILLKHDMEIKILKREDKNNV